MALPFFAITLFVSAFLLFIVEPMIGKTILPRLGGTPQVWNTCMVFFQMALLAGYAYTHFISSRLKLRGQLLVHGALLFVPFIVLLPWHGPFNIISGPLGDWTPPPGANPILHTLWLMTVIVGLPFFVVATSAPLLQKWFASTGHPAAKDPYFLYGASNLGSLLALIAYPLFFEPYLRLRVVTPEDPINMVFSSQPWLWTYGYVILVILVLGCVAMVWKAPPAVMLAGAGAVETPAREEARVETAVKAGAAIGVASKTTAIRKGAKQQRPLPPPRRREHEPVVSTDEYKRLEGLTWPRRLRWVLLAAIPSSLMLGVTTYITTDLSPIPLFWIIPLALYLLSFILVFSRWPVVWTGQPHDIMVLAQPVFIAILVFLLVGRSSVGSITAVILINVLAFFVTTMVCHGELAKDRPGTKHLTEFYLWMSVGGMLGGMFNGLLAPVLFVYVVEFGVAIFAACLLRPTLKEGGWVDTAFANIFAKPMPAGGGTRGAGRHHHVHRTNPEETPQLHYSLDVVLPLGILLLTAALALGITRPDPRTQEDATFRTNMFLSFGIPLAICCFYYARPIRFGLAVGAVLLVNAIYTQQNDTTIFADRSYFGILRVKEVKDSRTGQTYTNLLHGTTDHGMNFRRPEKKFWGDPDKDFSRLATTYYHRLGPAGVVMERFCWFHEGENQFHSDARMPASIWALGGDPWSQMVNLWSEPPYATIGLGTGTMASYARPYQHMHYYEIDNHIRRLSETVMATDGRPCFTYVGDAKARGAELWILMGDARLKMNEPYITLEQAREKLGADVKTFYSDSQEGRELRKQARDMTGGPRNFYHMMVVDAFSSDAIPVHLITKEAIKMYFDHLTEEGILCVHTSNRHVDLVPVVADVSASLGYTAWRGHDDTHEAEARAKGHYTSEWVMVARKAEYLSKLRAPEGYDESTHGTYWTPLSGTDRHVWTDDYSNLMGVYREFMH